ncbi:MAG: hypothetical protein V4702_02410 [Patescibacteria group bacterium]
MDMYQKGGRVTTETRRPGTGSHINRPPERLTGNLTNERTFRTRFPSDRDTYGPIKWRILTLGLGSKTKSDLANLKKELSTPIVFVEAEKKTPKGHVAPPRREVTKTVLAVRSEAMRRDGQRILAGAFVGVLALVGLSALTSNIHFGDTNVASASGSGVDRVEGEDSSATTQPAAATTTSLSPVTLPAPTTESSRWRSTDGTIECAPKDQTITVTFAQDKDEYPFNAWARAADDTQYENIDDDRAKAFFKDVERDFNDGVVVNVRGGTFEAPTDCKGLDQPLEPFEVPAAPKTP